MRNKFLLWLLSATILLAAGCNGGDKSGSSDAANPLYNSNSKPTAEFGGKLIIPWLKGLYYHIANEKLSPPEASRIYGYIGVTFYESVIGGMPDYQTFEGQLTDLKDIPRPDKSLEYDWPTVMTTAAYFVIDELLARHIGATTKTFHNIRDKQYAAREEAGVTAEVMNRSKEYGQVLSDHIVTWTTTDNYEDTRLKTEAYKTPSRDGYPEYWEPTDFNQQALEPYWSEIRTFVLNDGTACPMPLEHEFSMDTSSGFYKQTKEVYEYDKHLTEEERIIALFWADDPGETSTPPGHWIYIMNNMVNSTKMSLDKAAEMYGMAGVGIADAFVACWTTKYEINLVRPKTLIREHFGEPGWEPYVETPPFPEYTSGHSNVSGSAATILTHLLGEHPFVDSTHMIIGLEPRSFDSFWDAAEEAAWSRLYGGIHYKMAIERGLDQGKCVGEKVIESIKLKIDSNDEPQAMKSEES